MPSELMGLSLRWNDQRTGTDLVEVYSFFITRELPHTKEIAWEEFCEVYKNEFSSTVIEEKKIEFMALEQGDMTVTEYHFRFLALERFPPGTFQTKREQ